jgi:YbbR-like protein
MRLDWLMQRLSIDGISRRLRGAWTYTRKRASRNMGLRLLSIAIAIGLWVFVNAGERGGVRTMDVPLSYRTLPRGMMIINHPADFVKIEVAGPRTLLSLLEPERLRLKLELAGAAPGRSDYRIFPGMFNVPRGTTVTQIMPSDITLDLDRIVTRDVPVHVKLEGAVASGYKVSAVELKPSTIEVSGPSRYVQPMIVIETAPIDVQGATTPIEQKVDLAETPVPLRLSTSQIDARIEIAEEIADREFRAVSVEVRDSDYKYKLVPNKASLTVRGPAIKLASLDPNGLVFVDAKGVAPGSHELPVQVILPDGMQVVKQEPSTAKLRTYREKALQ